MSHYIHRSQILLYLQEHGLSLLESFQDISLAEHGLRVEWNFELSDLHNMVFNSDEQVFIIE